MMENRKEYELRYAGRDDKKVCSSRVDLESRLYRGSSSYQLNLGEENGMY